MGNICKQKEININVNKQLRLVGFDIQNNPNKQSIMQYYSYKISDNTDKFEDEFFNKNFQFENLETNQSNKLRLDGIIKSQYKIKNDQFYDDMSSPSQFQLDEKQTLSKKNRTQSKSASKNCLTKQNQKVNQYTSPHPSISNYLNQSPKSILKSPQCKHKSSKKCKEQDNQSQRSVRFRNSSLQQHQINGFNKSPKLKKKRNITTDQKLLSYSQFPYK